MQDANEYDILIIGGGPSGLSTALHLYKIAPHLVSSPQGASRILILEKEHYPRPKLCAGGLSVDAEAILEGLGLDVSEIPHADVQQIHFDFKNRGLIFRKPKSHALRVIRRNEFDHWLAQKVQQRGMEIRQGIAVKNIVPDENGVTVTTDQGDFHAQVVVGADGSNGITRRCIWPHEPVETARVLEILTPTYAHNSPGTLKKSGASGEGRERVAFFDFFPVPNNIAGYVWDFPTQVNGQAMRCWGVYDTNILAEYERPALKAPLAEEMKRHGFELNDYEIKGHPIRWYTPWNSVSAARVLLVGDAVGADPVFGEGISIALGFGAVAARELAESFRRDEFSFRRYKFRLIRSGLGQTLLARWIITYIIYPIKWKWFQFLIWRISKPIVLFVAWVFVLNWSSRLDWP